jgi:hypothetical protein
MNRNVRLLAVTAIVFTFTFFMVPTADARPFDVPSIDGATWLQAAWTWLGSLFAGGDDAEMQSATAEGRITTSSGTGGGGMVTMGAGSCIDPLGNPIPCPDIRP